MIHITRVLDFITGIPDNFSLGITGTRNGFSNEQLKNFDDIVQMIGNSHSIKEFHHGQCVGVDVQAASRLHPLNIDIVSHPPIKHDFLGVAPATTTLPAKHYMQRNADIINASDVLFVVPNTNQERNTGGTWRTYHKALLQEKPVILLLPNGTVRLIKKDLHPFEVIEDKILFLGGPFSNFCQCAITYRGVPFSSTEQAFMYAKAVEFSDATSAEKIKTLPYDPYQAKMLGRGVQGYVDSVWDKVRYQRMLEVNREKFKDPELRQILLNTQDHEIVECNPRDAVWSCGFAADDKRSLDKSKWRGANLLGEVLMQIRSEIKTREKSSQD